MDCRRGVRPVAAHHSVPKPDFALTARDESVQVLNVFCSSPPSHSKQAPCLSRRILHNKGDHRAPHARTAPRAFGTQEDPLMPLMASPPRPAAARTGRGRQPGRPPSCGGRPLGIGVGTPLLHAMPPLHPPSSLPPASPLLGGLQSTSDGASLLHARWRARAHPAPGRAHWHHRTHLHRTVAARSISKRRADNLPESSRAPRTHGTYC
jgi:hypothetical protein